MAGYFCGVIGFSSGCTCDYTRRCKIGARPTRITAKNTDKTRKHGITMAYPMRTIVTERYKYLINFTPDREFPLPSDLWASPSWQGIRSRGDKMMGRRSVDAFLHRPKEELYDLSKDRDEVANLAADSAHAE